MKDATFLQGHVHDETEPWTKRGVQKEGVVSHSKKTILSGKQTADGLCVISVCFNAKNLL